MEPVKEYVTTSAVLKCSCGTLVTPLQSSTTTVYIAGQLAATAADNKPFVNITPFGLCSITKQPCTLAVMQWLDYQIKVKFEGSAPLVDKSFLPCSLGGKIEVVATGQ